MVRKNTNLPIVVKENRVEVAGCRSIVFERPHGFDFDSGDWIDIAFGQEQLKGGKTYSLSSSPTEPDLVITFKHGISEIKKRLAALQPGDKACIKQYGNDYKFTLKPHQLSILIAGGVGIAPFRSMIKEMFDTKNNNEVSLIYLNKTSEVLFESELEQWTRQLPQSTMTQIITGELKKKDRTKALLSAIKSMDNSFYIAGPESMVENAEHLLLDVGVDLKNIKIDSFGGY